MIKINDDDDNDYDDSDDFSNGDSNGDGQNNGDDERGLNRVWKWSPDKS